MLSLIASRELLRARSIQTKEEAGAGPIRAGARARPRRGAGPSVYGQTGARGLSVPSLRRPSADWPPAVSGLWPARK